MNEVDEKRIQKEERPRERERDEKRKKRQTEKEWMFDKCAPVFSFS